jgi:hypothetical protein
LKPIAIFSTDNNPLYSEFDYPVSKAWEHMGFEPMCVKMHEIEPFVPQQEIPLGNQAQMIRVLLPALFPERMFLVSDIDMLPLSAKYFQKAIELPAENEIINISADAYPGKERLPICYFLGKGKTFSKVTGVKTKQDISSVMKKWWSNGHKWDTDELCFTKELIEAVKSQKISFKGYSRGWYQGMANFRIDREKWVYDKNALMNSEYIDSHMLRPLSEYSELLAPLFAHVGAKL